MSQFQVFPPPDHPHYRLLTELLAEIDRDTRELAAEHKSIIEDWCRRNGVDEASLLSITESQVASLLVNLVIMPGIKDYHPKMEDALPDALGTFCLAFTLGYGFALNRPDLP